MLDIALFLIAVELSAPMKIVQLPPEELRQVCPKARHRFDGCTRFRDWALSARCTAQGEKWSMDVSARYNAFVFLTDLMATGHERLHVRDMEIDVTAHLEHLEKRTFRTRAACDDAARSAESEFEPKLREFARRSQTRRD